mgnify:CR=1 FL=1
MNNTSSKYRCKLITEKLSWNKLLKQFDDANIYQTWSYAEIVQSEKKIDHIAIYKDDHLLGIALVRLKTIPIFKRGVAYIYRGPLWQMKGRENNLEIFSEILMALQDKYVIKLKYILKLRPFIFSDQFLSIDFGKILIALPTADNQVYKTLVLNLNSDIDTIRKNFKQKWRNCLNQSERNEIEIVSGNSNELYNTFVEIYDQMIKRKKFKEYVDIRKKGEMNELLSPDFKLKIFIAYKDKTPISALVASAMGNTGIYLLGASNELGMKYKSAYLLQWETIKWLKNLGISRYDLGGIDEVKNPGVFKFKVGISENEVRDFGSFEISNNKILKVFYNIIHLIRVKLMVLFNYMITLEEYGIKIDGY